MDNKILKKIASQAAVLNALVEQTAGYLNIAYKIGIITYMIEVSKKDGTIRVWRPYIDLVSQFNVKEVIPSDMSGNIINCIVSKYEQDRKTKIKDNN